MQCRWCGQGSSSGVVIFKWSRSFCSTMLKSQCFCIVLPIKTTRKVHVHEKDWRKKSRQLWWASTVSTIILRKNWKPIWTESSRQLLTNVALAIVWKMSKMSKRRQDFLKMYNMFLRCFQVVSKMFPRCFQDVSKLSPRCFQDFSKMFWYFQCVFKMFQTCFQDVSKMFPRCFQDVSKMFPISFQDFPRFSKMFQRFS
jgi:hypothetical protein